MLLTPPVNSCRCCTPNVCWCPNILLGTHWISCGTHRAYCDTQRVWCIELHLEVPNAPPAAPIVPSVVVAPLATKIDAKNQCVAVADPATQLIVAIAAHVVELAVPELTLDGLQEIVSYDTCLGLPHQVPSGQVCPFEVDHLPSTPTACSLINCSVYANCFLHITLMQTTLQSAIYNLNLVALVKSK